MQQFHYSMVPFGGTFHFVCDACLTDEDRTRRHTRRHAVDRETALTLACKRCVRRIADVGDDPPRHRWAVSGDTPYGPHLRCKACSVGFVEGADPEPDPDVTPCDRLNPSNEWIDQILQVHPDEPYRRFSERRAACRWVLERLAERGAPAHPDESVPQIHERIDELRRQAYRDTDADQVVRINCGWTLDAYAPLVADELPADTAYERGLGRPGA